MGVGGWSSGFEGWWLECEVWGVVFKAWVLGLGLQWMSLKT